MSEKLPAPVFQCEEIANGYLFTDGEGRKYFVHDVAKLMAMLTERANEALEDAHHHKWSGRFKITFGLEIEK